MIISLHVGWLMMMAMFGVTSCQRSARTVSRDDGEPSRQHRGGCVAEDEAVRPPA
jgi:hypothetical protein